MKKRIMAVVLIIALSFCLVSTEYRRAEASALGIPLLVALEIALGLSSVGAGVSYDVSDWSGFASGLAEFCNKAKSGVLYNWFMDIARLAKDPSTNTTLAVALDAVTSISQIDLSKYVLPLFSKYKIDSNVQSAMENYICAYKGYEILEPGVKMNTEEKITNFFTQYNLTDNDKSYLDYKYIIILRLSGIPYFWILASNDELSLNVKELSYNKYGIYFAHNDIAIWDYGNGSDKVKKQTYTKDGMVSILAGDRSENEYSLNASKCNYILLSNCNIKCKNSYMNNETIFPNGCIQQQINKTNYKWTDDKSMYTPQTITVSPSLADSVTNTSVKSNATTDDLITDVIKAHNASKAIGDNVLSTDIVNVGTAIGDTVIDKPTWYDEVLTGVKSIGAKVFIPSDVKVKEFVAEATDTIENKGGILTYPIELVIKFLNGVFALGASDCIMKIPKIEFKGYVLYAGMDFDFTQYINKSEFSELYRVYKLITNSIMILAVVALAIKKGEEIITGGLSTD